MFRNGTKTREESKNQKIQGERPNLPGPQTYQQGADWLVPAPPSNSWELRQKRARTSALSSQAAPFFSAPDRGTAQKCPCGSNRWPGISYHPDRGIDKMLVVSVSLTCEYITDPPADSPGNWVNLGCQSPSWKGEKDWQNSHS